MDDSRPIVVKIGGSTLGSHDTTIEDLAGLHERGERLVVVHGGGAAVSHALEASGHTVRFHRGLRVTDEKALEVVISVGAGVINTALVGQLAAAGVPAVGLTGVDGPTLLCRLDDPELGFVGVIEKVDPALLESLLASRFVPVVAPVGVLLEDGRPVGQALNLNADTVAGHLASALGAQILVLLTDIEGVRGAEGGVIRELSRARFEELRTAGVIAGGMLPKVSAALVAVEGGVPALVADGRKTGALPAALAGAAGTRIVP